MRVKDIAVRDRPRERLLAQGSDALADRELLAILLGSGTAGTDAITLAGQMLSEHGNLYELSRTDPHALLRVPGMGPAKVARLAAAFELVRRAQPETGRAKITTTADLAHVVAPLLRSHARERVAVVVCDSANRVLRAVTLTEGATDRSLVPIREVLATVLATNGTAFGLGHNHPSGDPAPSESDRSITARLREASKAVGLRFIDHVVVAGTAWRRVKNDY